MGVYSNNRSSLGPMNIVAAEGYNGAIGAAQIMIESCQNDQTFFEAVIGNDFKEAFGVAEGTVLESELTVLSEASLGGIIDKIKEMLHKLAEKIKGLFAAFKARISQVFVRDNKKFVEMHKKAVLQKDLSGMKYKYSKGKNEPKAINFDFHKSFDDFSGIKDTKALSSYMDTTFGDGEAEKKALGSVIGQGTVDLGEFHKELHEYLWEDEDEVEGLATSELTRIMSVLTTASQTIKDADKAANDMLKAINDAIKAIDKSRNAIVKFVPGKEDGSVSVDGKDVAFSGKDQRDLVNAKLNAMYKAATVIQTATTKAAAAVMNELKFGIAQDRRVFAQAAAYGGKHEACLMDVVAEASNGEVDDMIDGYEDVNIDASDAE